ELHQAFARRRPARIEPRLVDGADHRAPRQKPGAGFSKRLGEVVERRAADMDIAGSIGVLTCAIRHRAVERDVNPEKGLAPIVALDLAGDGLADLRLAEQVERKMTRIDIRGEHAVERNDLAVFEAEVALPFSTAML